MAGVVYLDEDGILCGFAGAKRKPLKEVLPAYFSIAQIREILGIPTEDLEGKLLELPEITCEQYNSTRYYWLDLQTIKTLTGDLEIEEDIWKMFLNHPIGQFPLETFDSDNPSEPAVYATEGVAVFIMLRRNKREEDVSERILDLMREGVSDHGLTGMGRYYSFFDNPYFIGVMGLENYGGFSKAMKRKGFEVQKVKEGNPLYETLEFVEGELDRQNSQILPCHQNLPREDWIKEIIDYFRSFS